MKRNNFVIISIRKNKKTILAFLFVVVIMVLTTIPYFNIVQASVKNFNGITIVVDAGHGGRDGGCVGGNGTIEKEINLEYAECLKDMMVKRGYRVVMTRKTDEGLYNNLSKNKKQSDMKARLEIIKKANPNLVISVHMNSFSSADAYGASTYYRKGDEASKNCADIIQSCIANKCNTKYTKGKVGDYYMVNSSYYTAVLIECGFLSNTAEERLLNTIEYKERFCSAVMDGLLLYFGK